MKSVLLLLLQVFAASITMAQYKPIEQASTLKFTIKNLGFDVEGSFSDFAGSINFDPQSPSNSSFDVTINASTINTDNRLRDEHLKGDGFFDVKNYPRIRLSSVKITPRGDAYLFTGQLAIKGRSQAVSFPFSAVPSTGGYVFKGTFKINRKDFGVGGTSTVSDELEVTINVTAAKV